MGWQPDEEREPDGEYGPGAGLPGGPETPRSPGQAPRDRRLPGFARGQKWDSCAPSAALAVALEGVSGPGWRCPGAERDELFGLLRRWAALESWAAAGKMGLLRALMRKDDLPLPGGSYHGDLPTGWSRSLTHEVALALAMPSTSAESLMWTAWDLQALLPGIGRLLADGTLTPAKARAVAEALAPLGREDMARAEAMILPRLAGKTYGQAEKLAVQAAITADPESAAKRREDAERNRAKVSLRRGPSGAANLSGYDLPTDETLAAHAQVCARAEEYKNSGVFPDVRMDQLRARAYLDILNGITAAARIAAGQPDTGLGAPSDPDTPADGGPVDDGPADGDPGGPSGGHPDSAGPGNEPGAGPGGRPGRYRGPDHAGDGGCEGSAPAAPPLPDPPRLAPRLADLVFPLATLLGRARRPGEGYGLGPLDPDLCRALAATAVNSPHSTLCVTVTDPRGYALGHGCARPAAMPRPAGTPGRPACLSRPAAAQPQPARPALSRHCPPG